MLEIDVLEKIIRIVIKSTSPGYIKITKGQIQAFDLFKM